MFKHLRRMSDLHRTLHRVLLRARPGAYPEVVFTDQHTPDQVTTYEVAREILGRQLGQALAAKRAATDPLERERHHSSATRPGRSSRTPDIWSVKTRSHPAAARASRCWSRS